MGRGGDLTDQERAFVLNKIMHNWNSELKKVYLKPILTEQNKILRMKYALAQIDRSHGRKRIRFKDNKRTIMVDESWFYLIDYDRCVRLCR